MYVNWLNVQPTESLDWSKSFPLRKKIGKVVWACGEVVKFVEKLSSNILSSNKNSKKDMYTSQKELRNGMKDNKIRH